MDVKNTDIIPYCDHVFKEITVPVAGPMIEVFKVCEKCGIEKDRQIKVNPRIIK